MNANANTTRIWKSNEIWENIQKNQLWLERSILAIFQKQTDEEQFAWKTKDRNGVGFNGIDANFMTGIANWLLSGKKLSGKQSMICRKIMRKYCKQLARIANREI